MIRRFFRFSFPTLYTPGPVKTTQRTKDAVLIDYGSRDPTFSRMVEEIKVKVLRIAELSETEYTTIIMQGPGSYGVEGALGAIKKDGSEKILVARNGHYGMNIEKIARTLKIPYKVIEKPENQSITPSDVVNALEDNITHFSMVHSETPTGMLNPLSSICQALNETKPGLVKIIDGISSFGMAPIDLKSAKIHYYCTSFNKFLQGHPGSGLVLAELNQLKKTKGLAHSLSLDLYDQWDYQLKNYGQFRFTPPTHMLAALHASLCEAEEHGGIQRRLEILRENQRVMHSELHKIGFKPFLAPENQALCVTTYYQPSHPNWDFNTFQNALCEKGVWIYPTCVTKSAKTFRVSVLGDHDTESTLHLVNSIKETLKEMKIEIPLK
ncbi:unnamed protein product [Blepharisma stoltei]|uniref:Aminotransferase class V domain-containing protein n=1 Tax=Blepharisma stoltei TaxID=1481888 RepID=A0AAU9JLY2_9CILI|nr:unnamed protein product [Blepharisma stoltei]